MKTIAPNHTFLALLGSLGLSLTALPSAHAAMLIYYNFDSLAAGPVGADVPVANGGTLGGSGTLTNGTGGGQATVVASGAGAGSGNAILFAPNGDGQQNGEAPHIGTGQTLSLLGITPSTAYTVMAWANFASTSGDNMIFGQDGGVANGGNSLHMGTRNGMLHSGHWGDDLGPDQGVNIPSGSDWHHVAYTNDSAGTQSIWYDGVMVASGAAGTGGGMDVAQALWIATSNNGGSFSGSLDEVKVFDTQLTGLEIQNAMAIPEPAGFATLALSGAMLLRRRRR